MAVLTGATRIAALPTESRSWLDNVSADTRRALSESAQKVTLSKGQTLYERKAAPTGIFVIIKGHVRITFQSPTGTHHLVKIGAPGGVVGDLACVDDQPYPVFVEAMTSCTFEFVPKKAFELLRERHSDLNPALLMHFARISRSLINMMEVTFLGDVNTRVASRLAFLSREYGGMTLTISQTDLGLMVGLSRQATNAALKSLTDIGLIDRQYGKIKILDFDGLVAFTERAT